MSGSREVIASIEDEYRRYRAIAEGAFDQLPEAQLGAGGDGTSSVATIAWHISGNLASRFTDFLTSDGEKPWRNRESEFESREGITAAELRSKWDGGWAILLDALALLTDEDLSRAVTIRGVSLTVLEALHRSLAHAAYHVGQIVYRAKALRGAGWTYLSIPPGGSEAYNRNPTREKAPGGPPASS